MKRSWDDDGSGSGANAGAGGSGWASGYDHPYATGYNSVPAFPTLESSMNAQAYHYPDGRNGTNLEDEMGDDDDDDEGDDDDDGEGDDRGGSGKGTPAKGKGRTGNDGKPKAKLTRGSR